MKRIALIALLPLACTDPVRDRRIAELGGEDASTPIGPDHRPGQPCLVCHSPGGPAEDTPFVVAGTIYENESATSKGAEGIVVQFVDSRNTAPDEPPRTFRSGNFFVPADKWPRAAFPMRVAIYKDPNQAPLQKMRSLIGREGSCNFCHKRNFGADLDEEAKESLKSEAGQIYVTSGGRP